MCDGLIVLVGQASGTNEQATAESRQGLWDAVFADGWDTNCTNPHPGPIRARKAVELMLQVGTWAVNLPVTTPSKRKKSGQDVAIQTNPHRLAGAPAYLKPNMNWSHFCDATGSAASDHYLKLFHGWTLPQAYSECITHFDRNEAKRVGAYNNSLIICWARASLVLALRVAGEGNNQGTAVPPGSRPIGAINQITINTNELVKFETCRQRILDMRQLVEDAGAIARQSKPSTLASLRNRD
jgi:hypothetical protein